jgi:serine/threonine-protein kinase RsbW
MRLPEVIGVAPWRPAVSARPAPALYYGRAYREGKYQRSHEEVWVAIDLSTVKILTTPEIDAALRQAEALEATLRPNRFSRWLILGEGASPEALELIKTQGFYCSSREQLALIQELISQTPTAVEEDAATGPAAAAQPPGTRGMRHSVIELRAPAVEPRSEVSSLRLPAREGSELIAAMTAEKIALRSDFEPAQAGQIKTAVLEGVLNGIEHSLNAEKTIDVQFMLSPEMLEVLIENEGPAFDPLAVPTPNPQLKLTSTHKRGWGLSLMKRFMDEVGYEPCERGTRLRLVKRRRRSQTGAAEEVR